MVTELPTAKKPVEWIASSKDDLNELPWTAKRVLTFAVYLAQLGETHPDAKPMKGFGGAGVIEVIENYDGNTYRAVYTIKFADVVYVLDRFKRNPSEARKRQRRIWIASRAG